MRVNELWRFPVKSLQGERVDGGELGPEGLEGDRRYAIFDVDTGFGLTARRAPEMLFASARLRGDGSAEITLPDGSVSRGDDDLSTWLGRRVALRSTADVGQRRYENPDDIETEAAASWAPFEGARGAFHDSGSAAVTLVSTDTLQGRDIRRFRTNVVLDGGGEDGLVGTGVQLGTARLEVTGPVPRCVMVTRAQPGGIEVDRDVLRRIHRERAGMLSVGCLITAPGSVRVGDELTPA
jgi:uncharacterized protein YcbX